MGFKVIIRGLNQQGNDVEFGSIEWDGARWWLRPEGKEVLLRTLREPIAVETDLGLTPLYARDEPERFLRQLQIEFKSAYFRASAVEETPSRPS